MAVFSAGITYNDGQGVSKKPLDAGSGDPFAITDRLAGSSSKLLGSQ